MEPEPSTGMIKLVNEFAGYTNIQPWLPFPRNIAHSLPCSPFTSDPVKMSVPRSHALNPSDTIPTECAVAIESLVANCLPFLKGRQLIQKAMCWCTDTVDSNWLICRDPRWSTAEQSAKVIIASGDSGQTFKMFPVVGRQVADLIENKVSQRAWQFETLSSTLIFPARARKTAALALAAQFPRCQRHREGGRAAKGPERCARVEARRVQISLVVLHHRYDCTTHLSSAA